MTHFWIVCTILVIWAILTNRLLSKMLRRIAILEEKLERLHPWNWELDE